MRLPLELFDRLRQLKAQAKQEPSSFLLTMGGVYFAVLAWVELYRWAMNEVLRPLWLIVRAVVWALALVLIVAGVVEATSCTKGTNCYCDRVQGGDLNDTSILFCEDFEAPTLDCGGADAPSCASRASNGGPYWGGPVAHTPSVASLSNDRGGNSYWARKFLNGVGSVSWVFPAPSATPTYGVQCNPGGSGICYGTKFWDATDRWQANSSNNVGAVILGANTAFNSEVATIAAPTGSAGGGSGVFDGTNSFGFRVPRGNNCSPADSCANVGYLSQVLPIGGWGGTGGLRRDFGVTAAVAFPNNLITSGVIDANWKFDEWANTLDTDGIFMFGFAGEGGTNFPFYQFTFNRGSANCTTAVSGATVLAGRVACDGGTTSNFTWRASQTDTDLTQRYVQSSDWPLGTWGCVQAYYQNMGTSTSHVQMWFTGPAGTQKKIVDFTANLVGFAADSGYSGVRWNAYANANQGQGATATSATTFRYIDNYHIRSGAPVSCAQIGYGTAPASRGFILRSLFLGALILFALIPVAIRVRTA